MVFDHPDCSVTWEHLSWHPRGLDGSRVGVSFQGSGGALVTDGAGFRIYNQVGQLLEEVAPERHDGLHQQDFVDAVRNSTQPNSDLRDGLVSSWWCHLGNLAHRSGQVVTVDPKTGSPGASAEQHAAWRRAYEPGWEPPGIGA